MKSVISSLLASGVQSDIRLNVKTKAQSGITALYTFNPISIYTQGYIHRSSNDQLQEMTLTVQQSDEADT